MKPDKAESKETVVLTPEAVFAAEQHIPRSRLKQWREEGALEEGTHWRKCSQAFVLTDEGCNRALGLAGLPAAPEPSEDAHATVEVHKCRQGVLARVLRAHRVDNGMAVSIRLTAPNVFASHFRFHDRFHATPTETDGVLEYAGRRPMRVRI